MIHGARRFHAPPIRAVRTGIALLVIGVCATACTGAGEPGYEGRSSASWAAALHDPDSLVRRDAAQALGEILTIAPSSHATVSALIAALADSSDVVQLAAGDALTRNGALPDAAVPGVLGGLADSAHAHTREHSAALLGYASTTMAPQITTRLLAVLAGAHRDPDRAVRASAASALSRVGVGPWLTSTAARAAIRLAIRDDDDLVRKSAIDALARITPPDPPNDVPAYVLALNDTSSWVRASAAFALAGLREAAAPAVDALLLHLTDPSAPVRQATADALENIGPAAHAALPALQRALADPNYEVQSEAKKAITRITTTAP
jgi:HEAT repeat protein